MHRTGNSMSRPKFLTKFLAIIRVPEHVLCYVMLCYVIWLFVKRLSQEAIQRRSQRDRLVKRKVFKLRRDADDIPCSTTLRSAGGESFHSAGPTTEKARFWDREVRDQGTLYKKITAISRAQRTRG